MVTLLQELREWEKLPRWVDKDRALVTLINQYRRDDPRVEAVFQGRTSFQILVSQLVGYNKALRLIWNPRQVGVVFTLLRKEVQEELGGLLYWDYDYYDAMSRKHHVSLLKDHVFPKLRILFLALVMVVTMLVGIMAYHYGWVGGLITLSLVLAFMAWMYLADALNELQDRYALATRLMEDARFVDETLLSMRSLVLV